MVEESQTLLIVRVYEPGLSLGQLGTLLISLQSAIRGTGTVLDRPPPNLSVRPGEIRPGSLIIPVEVLQWSPELALEVGRLVVQNAASLAVNVAEGLIGAMIWEHLRSRGNQSVTQESVTERASLLDASVTPPSAMDAYEVDLDRARRRDADRRAVSRRLADDLGVNPVIVDAAVQSIEATARTVALISRSGGGSIDSPPSSSHADITKSGG